MVLTRGVSSGVLLCVPHVKMNAICARFSQSTVYGGIFDEGRISWRCDYVGRVCGGWRGCDEVDCAANEVEVPSPRRLGVTRQLMPMGSGPCRSVGKEQAVGSNITRVSRKIILPSRRE